MKIEPKIAQRMVKNIGVSLLIYALPIILMLLTFYFNGQRPWKKKIKSEIHESVKLNSTSN
jgi:preprotein translocase subunit YajC